MWRLKRLHGRVVDGEQRPVANALVRVTPGGRTALTNASGEFELTCVRAGQYRLSASKDDLYTWAEFVGPTELSEPVVLRARLGASLVMHVFGEHAPIVGAELVLDESIRARTDRSGTLTIRGLAPHDYEGTLSAEGWAQMPVYLYLVEDPGGVVEQHVTLRRGSRIEGVVLRPFGRGAPDVRVWCWGGSKAPYQATSDSDGRWHVYAKAGAYRVFARSAKYIANEQVPVECDGQSPVRDVVLRVKYPKPQLESLARRGRRILSRGKSERISGRVLDDAHQPASGAHIQLRDTSPHRAPIVKGRADSRGRFNIEGIAPGEYEVVAGWRESRGRSEWSVERRVRAGDTDVVVVLPDGGDGTVAGRAVMDGQPLSYYGVSLTAPKHFGGNLIGIRTTDGRFTLPHVPPGTWQMVVLGPGTRAKLIEEIVVGRGQHVDLGDVAMEPGRRVAGHVRDRSGAPVANARVVIGSPSMFTRESRLEQSFGGHFETMTDAAGAYTFDRIDGMIEAVFPMRAVRISAAHPDVGASLIREIPETSAMATIDFTLLGFGRLEGVVQGLRGGHAMVLATRADEPPVRLSGIYEEGRFEFDDLPPGDYVVTLTGPEEREVTPVNVTVAENETARATIWMTTSSVRLTVRVALGRSKDVKLEPTSPGAGVGGRMRGCCVVSNQDEFCSFDFVRPGDYRVSLDGNTWTPLVVGDAPAEQAIDLRHLA